MTERLASIDLFFAEIANAFFGHDVRINPIYIGTFVMIALFIFIARKPRKKSFFTWLFPKDIYLHTSHMTDVKLFAINRVLAFVGFFKGFAATVAIAAVTSSLLTFMFGAGSSEPTKGWTDIIAITLLITLANDFSVYWVHRMSHQMEILWPFHRVHHSAEVLTPLTTYRKHPIYDIISVLVKSLIGGMIQGFIIYFLFSELSILIIGTVNGVYFIFNLLGSNIRHSHISLGYGRFMEHIFISPSQHQIHHSLDPKHFNKNFGEIFAIWDWMFGSLYLSKPGEALIFGLGDEYGNKIPQIHNGALQAMSEPFIASGRAFLPPQKTDAKINR